MNITARSYLTAGVAAVGAGAMALTPVAPIPASNLTGDSHRVVSDLAVSLAADLGPCTLVSCWTETFKAAAANVKTLAEFYLQQPAPLLQTIVANQVTYFKALPDFQFIAESLANNLTTFFKAPWWNSEGNPIVNGTYGSEYISGTQTVQAFGVLFGSQRSVYDIAAPLIAPDPGTLQSVLEFTATPYSSQIIGLISPLLGQISQLTKSFTEIGALFQAGDVAGAIKELLNIPARTTNAQLNGFGVLDLTAVIKNLVPPEIAPIIKEFGVNLSGLLSPPVPFDGSLTNPSKPPTVYTGGTLFDAVQAKASVGGIGAETTGLPVGLAGAVIGMGQFLGKQMLVTPPPPAVTPPAQAAKAPAAAAAAEAVVADDPAPQKVSADNSDSDAPAAAPKVRRGSNNDNGGASRAGGRHRAAS